MQLQMDHIVLNVEDEYAMAAFYAKVLLLSPERLEAYGRGEVPFPSVRINGDTIIDLFPKKMWASDPKAERNRENESESLLSIHGKSLMGQPPRKADRS